MLRRFGKYVKNAAAALPSDARHDMEPSLPPWCSHGTRAPATSPLRAAPYLPDRITNAAIRCTGVALTDALRQESV